jgi:hypothetical protein
MNELIEKLLGESDDGNIMAQVMVPGAAFQGALRATEHSGIYELLMVAPGGQKNTFFIAADAVQAFGVLEEASAIATPGSMFQ